ncbi:MAG: sigma-54 dependent transcriptional regulator [Pseudomonadota bacterium]
MKLNARILVVDDDREMRQSLAHLLSSAGADVETLSDARVAAERLAQPDFDLLLCDVRMPGYGGLDIVNDCAAGTDVPIVLMSAHGDVRMAVDALQAGAYSFVEKPFEPRRLVKILSNAAEKLELSRAAKRLRERLADATGIGRQLLGSSAAIVRLRDELLEVADSDLSVALVGETGTGKELAARAIHGASVRQDGNFIALHCAAVAPSAFETTLFGTAGAPLGGMLAAADGGTLFVDELSSLTQDMQVKLLRVFETGEYIPVGASTPQTTDMRLISASQQELEGLVQAEQLRADLMFRLNGAALRLPPLKARGSDALELFEYFSARFAARYEAADTDLAPDDLSVLMNHDWPGNVRELRNLAERFVLARRYRDVSLRDVLSGGLDDDTTPQTLRDATAAFERQMIGRALREHDGRMDEVAAALGIGRRTLNEKIVKLGLDKAKYLGA